MCGIAGWVTRGGGFDEAAARREVAGMLATIAHRGPDGAGIDAGPGFALGHRRLAIIDRSDRAAQPMRLRCAGDAPDVRIVCNGEIFNYVELREALEARGHRFRSDSDIEVILHLYEDRGADCVTPLRGMFAFALWDGARRRLMIARDRLGEKPIYWREEADGIAFASEIKALLALTRARGAGVEVDPEAIRTYLTLKYVPGPATAIRGIRKLPPAHVLLCEEGGATVRPYWELPEMDGAAGGGEGSVEALAEAIREAVRIRMRSDVPIGLFLSGGLDSGIVASVMAPLARASGERLRTFTVRFQDADYDEMSAAAAMAHAVGADHVEIPLAPTPAETIDLLPDLAWHLDQPLADSSALAMHHLAREVRRHVTVALSGDGADELFLGYDRYRAHRLADGLGSIAGRGIGARWLRRAVDWIPTPAGRRNLRGRATRFLDACSLPRGARNDAWVTCHTGGSLGRVLTPEFLGAAGASDPHAALHRHYDGAADAPIEAIQRADLLVWLPDDILHKVDMTTMTHALESRSPFLDHVVVERAMRLPTAEKIGARGPGKACLRSAFGAALPDRTLRGRKAGFGIPIDHWMRADLASYCREVLTDAAARQRGVIRPEGAADLIDEHVRGEANREEAIWALVMLEHWFRAIFDAARYPAASEVEAAAR